MKDKRDGKNRRMRGYIKGQKDGEVGEREVYQ